MRIILVITVILLGAPNAAQARTHHCPSNYKHGRPEAYGPHLNEAGEEQGVEPTRWQQPLYNITVSGISCRAAGIERAEEESGRARYGWLGIIQDMNSWPVPQKVAVYNPIPPEETFPLQHWTCRGTTPKGIRRGLGYYVVCRRGRATVTGEMAT